MLMSLITIIFINNNNNNSNNSNNNEYTDNICIEHYYNK